MSGQPRVALVGAGSMGTHHARVLAQSPRCALVSIVDPDELVARPLAERYGVRWLPDLDVGKLDAVVVASATETHAEVARQVLGAGLPLLVEKPAALRLEQTQAMVEEARARGLPLVCGLLERFNPAVRTATQIIDAPVQILGVRHSPFVPRIRTGVATDLLIHDVDLAIHLTREEPSVVRGGLGYYHESSITNRSEDSADVVLRFPSGATANVSASRTGQRKIRSLWIYELDRLIELDLLRRDLTIYRHVSDSPAFDDLGYRQQTVIEIPTLTHSEEPLAAQLDHFLDLVEGRGDPEAERSMILPAHRVVDELERTSA